MFTATVLVIYCHIIENLKIHCLKTTNVYFLSFSFFSVSFTAQLNASASRSLMGLQSRHHLGLCSHMKIQLKKVDHTSSCVSGGRNHLGSLQRLPTIASLFKTAPNWKQLGCSLIRKWINKVWCIHTIEYFSVIKRLS